MQKTFAFLLHLLGFEKMDSFVRDYLHDSNLDGSMYLGFITVALELWILTRQVYSKVIPNCLAGAELFPTMLKYTSKFWILLILGIGLALLGMFCHLHKDGRMSKGWFLTLLLIGSASVLYTSVLRVESFTKVTDSITPIMAGIMNFMVISLYMCNFLIGLSIVSYSLLLYRKQKRIIAIEHWIIIIFALLNVSFGVLVSYSDFWERKEITCFLMMMVYAGYITIYRPYITVLTLTAGFAAFYRILLTFQGGLSFKIKEFLINGVTYRVTSGDTANYITFLVSLIAICVAIYHGRLREAKEAEALEKSASFSHEQFIQTADALASAIDAKDTYTNGHSRRVAEYSQKIAQIVGKSKEECEKIFFAGLLHDVGKIGILDSIITKTGRLTDEEFEMIKQHPATGGQILSTIKQSPWLSIGAKYHHERYDGKGYPEGLNGKEIPELARIIAVADAYDAMTSNRSYRNALPQHIVREEIVKSIGTQFDPVFAKAMIQMIDNDTEYQMQEVRTGKKLASSLSLRCDSIYNGCTDGVLITNKPVEISFCSHSYSDFSDNECLPSLILYDALDGKVHPGEENNRNLMYHEYAQIRMDGRVTEEGARKVKVIEQESRLEPLHYTHSRIEKKFLVEAVRLRDHALITVSDETHSFKVILALPDATRFLYISLSGEHCELYSIRVKNFEHEIKPEAIPRIAEEISFIKGCPEGDLPNIEVDGWRSDATPGVLLGKGMTLTFHSMSLPTARMVWHCPFVSVFSSNDGRVNGDGFLEYLLLRLNGENWESDEHVINEVQFKHTEAFQNWNVWKEKNKEGLDFTVKIERVNNKIYIDTETLGVAIKSTTTISDSKKEVYVALTGDQCAITNIHVLR